MTYDQALSRLTSLCSRAEYCRHDVQEKLRRWGVAAADQTALLAFLEAEHYIDDCRFARLFARDKLRFNRWGRQKIYTSLVQKHIDKDAINAALDEIADSDYIAILRDVLRQKARTVKAASDYERQAKLMRFAQGRGFTADIIRQCLDSDPDDN